MFVLQWKLSKATTPSGVSGAIVPPLVGLERSFEQGTAPIPLLRLVVWIVRLLVWTEMCKSARKGHVQVSIKNQILIFGFYKANSRDS